MLSFSLLGNAGQASACRRKNTTSERRRFAITTAKVVENYQSFARQAKAYPTD